MRHAFILALVIFTNINIQAQLYDSFLDDDFTSNPVWVGDTSDWKIIGSASGINVSSSKSLRLDAKVNENGVKYLSSQISGSWGTEQSWGLWIGRRTPLTFTNQSVIWLWANESDLTSNTVDGYRITMGDNNGDDEILLERIDDSLATTVLASSDSILNGLNDYGILIRVTRTSGSVWTLFTSALPDTSGGGALSTDIPSSINTNINQGSSTDNTYTIFDNGYIGVECIYTKSNRDAFEFDQFYFDTDASSPLPVELLNFNACELNGKVLLSWETATEVNNYGFEVERTTPRPPPYQGGGAEFGGGWETIGFVNGNGNSNSNIYYNFTDNNPGDGNNLYRLKQIDFDGVFEYSKTEGISLIKSQQEFELKQNYPNPFNPTTTISFTIPTSKVLSSFEKGRNGAWLVNLVIFDILGNQISVLINNKRLTGHNKINFDGSRLSSGVYYYTLTAGSFHKSRKMLLIK